ncbi:MAG: hypothetical protein KJ727_09745 [Acidobacteria bacterium]|nr:hypothetical protein [Acidobacteriota bacterium]MBU4496127.1 hypothetical protein [Acidobacteriota bacterium]
MAGFEGIKWAPKQMRFSLKDRRLDILEPDAKVYAVSRSIHYGLCLVFEGIRFFCRIGDAGRPEVTFLNLRKNLERFQKGILFNLSRAQRHLVPTPEKLIDVFLSYFREPEMTAFLKDMSAGEAQGYLRPFTVDEQQSIGVTFPENPSIRAVSCRYDRYMGEPFAGVVIPDLVRAVGINGTGCLKLGVNYLMSIKAVDKAKQILPEAASALFLDDMPHKPIKTRNVTEWDSSCCLFALRDGTVVKIPENPLILPSVTIGGICAILRDMGVTVDERHMTYGELIEKTKSGDLVVICSIGTAGILNRAQKLLLIDANKNTIAIHKADESHDLYEKLGRARTIYWDIYKGKEPVPEGLSLDKYPI